MDSTSTTSTTAADATVNGARSGDKETVTSLVAKGLDPEQAVATIFKEQGLLNSLWIVLVYLLEAVGLKADSKIHDNYAHEQLDLEAVAKKGNFPYRPSDLFLRVWSIVCGG
jgi:hypothetical protein